jgi:hypothetical protein
LNDPPTIDLHDFDQLPMTGRERYKVDAQSSRVAHLWIAILLISLTLFMVNRGDFDLVWYLVILGVVGLASVVVELVLLLAKDSAIMIDYERQVVVLEHYVYPLGFWDFRSKPEVVIPFSEIQHVSRFEGKGGRTYFVYTKRSRFNLGQTIDRVDQLATSLESIASGPIPLHPLRNVWILGTMASVVGGGLVLLLAWMLGWL